MNLNRYFRQDRSHLLCALGMQKNVNYSQTVSAFFPKELFELSLLAKLRDLLTSDDVIIALICISYCKKLFNLKFN